MFQKSMQIQGYDDELWAAMQAEERRQEEHIELIASENYASPRVMQAQGGVMTNKYAEGYPHKRYYGGCENVDVAEQLAIDRAKALFDADFANVQPHSGSQANAAVYMALCQPGDTVLGMSLAHGGHLTHGAKPNFSGKIYHAVQYGLNAETGEIDYQEVEQLAREHKPKMIVAGFSAYSRVVDWQRFRDIADEVGACLFVDMAHVGGLIAAGLYPSPVQIADVTTTTTHKTLRGPRGGLILAKVNLEIEKKLNSLVFPGTQGGPLMHVIAAKAVAFKEAMEPEYKLYQQQVIDNARAMVKVFMDRGCDVVSKGTDDHLFLVSFIEAGLTGKDVDAWLGAANITVNKNAVPNDPQSPFVTSGIRVGTPAATTRGFNESDCVELAGWMCDVIDSRGDQTVIGTIKSKVLAICARYPVYQD
ncbi:MAG: serine hydroxymethyltransferase [Candidatus Thiodiazotropha sp. (ex Lucinoma aequizonata)]|nr:serine hydroxymethyltransferase [Candidatus Thiodiazotropha sp. (ex Lucinoma aequizonata)]MCU7888999.1 serine hydroxymethyltransferase [Candidatus Thiodiazotropha sp. (ex Lucinoma aequizonata)]MCU7895297.1 serine hydroxymethyltransferase [Candidatus Thiodiazotropha sp. (ex Lucinoma aequizonata)]MCU7898228.1 serine hydroxymethyltransferase [Candidatus Thiodiazotropha sp. (ex Lucinoma aequizonata)]MCU7903694.1 serine hydroxymethyltransferase [Candidatus Thiodiazotropha sp. (ex Lucinoma aequizo